MVKIRWIFFVIHLISINVLMAKNGFWSTTNKEKESTKLDNESIQVPKTNPTNENFLTLSRTYEVNEFYQKLNKSMMNSFKIQNLSDETIEKLLDKFRHLVGDGKYAIIFDCKNPSYLNLESKRIELKSSKILKDLRKNDNCTKNDEKLWHYNGIKSYISTYDFETKSLSTILLPFGPILQFFYRLDVCHDFMKLMKHPGYYLKNYKKPVECHELQNSFKEIKRSMPF